MILPLYLIYCHLASQELKIMASVVYLPFNQVGKRWSSFSVFVTSYIHLLEGVNPTTSFCFFGLKLDKLKELNNQVENY